jgi:hypothetical protein
MAFMKTLLIASVAAFVAAAPGYDQAAPAVAQPAQAAPAQAEPAGNTKVDVSSQSNDAVCGNDQKLACCNSGEDLIGANCLSIPIREFHSHSILTSAIQGMFSNKIYSGHPHPASLRLQRRRLLPDRRRQGQPHQPRAQLPRHPPLSVSSSRARFLLLVGKFQPRPLLFHFFASSTSFFGGGSFLIHGGWLLRG